MASHKFILILLVIMCGSESQRLIGFTEYFIRVLQETVYELEDRDWCNFRVPHIHYNQTINFYDWPVQYEVDFANGFLVSFSSLDIRPDTVQDRLGAQTFGVQGRMQMHDIVTGYDVTAVTPYETTRHTATYPHLMLGITFIIEKSLATGEISTRAQFDSQSGVSGGRVDILPSTNLTQVISRIFYAYTIDLSGWTTNFLEVMDDIAKNRIQFPELCYNCS